MRTVLESSICIPDGGTSVSSDSAGERYPLRAMSGNSSSDKAADELNRRWRAVAPRVGLFVVKVLGGARGVQSGKSERARALLFFLVNAFSVNCPSKRNGVLAFLVQDTGGAGRSVQASLQ